MSWTAAYNESVIAQDDTSVSEGFRHCLDAKHFVFLDECVVCFDQLASVVVDS